MIEAQHHRDTHCIYLKTQQKIIYRNQSWYQLNFEVILSTMEAGVGEKEIITCLGILDIPEVKSYIGHNVLKLVDNKIGPTI